MYSGGNRERGTEEEINGEGTKNREDLLRGELERTFVRGFRNYKRKRKSVEMEEEIKGTAGREEGGGKMKRER